MNYNFYIVNPEPFQVYSKIRDFIKLPETDERYEDPDHIVNHSGHNEPLDPKKLYKNIFGVSGMKPSPEESL